MDATLPVGIVCRQYPEVIYLAVFVQNNPAMDNTEHWRLRLIELKEALGETQAAMAQSIRVDASYFSRLLYPPGKKARKNLGLQTMRALVSVYKLQADWFDLPLGSMLPRKAGQHFPDREIGAGVIASEPTGPVPLHSAVRWPFRETSYRRLQALLEDLGPAAGAEARRDLDKVLDAAVSRWEQVAALLRKQTG